MARTSPRQERDAAVAAAEVAGALIRRAFGQEQRVTLKAARDIVTEVDTASQAEILGVLRQAGTGYGVLAEESPMQPAANGARWIVDPLDGTVNFSRGLPRFCVSIALEREGVVVLGVIFDPMADELFVALAGQGATLNGRPIRVSRNRSWGGAIMSTGFPSGDWQASPADGQAIAWIAARVLAVRSTGSAALDLADVACGRRDAHWERGLFPYDVGAGTLLVREAGGVVSDYRGGGDPLYAGEIVAANPVLHRRLIARLAADHLETST